MRRSIASLAVCLSLAAFAAAEVPDVVRSVVEARGVRADAPGRVETRTTVKRSDGSVVVELRAGEKTLATAKGTATPQELAHLDHALDAIRARVVWSSSGSAPLAPSCRTIVGAMDGAVLRDAKLGAITVKDTPASGSLAWHLAKSKGAQRLSGALKGTTLEVQAADAVAARTTKLYLFATADGWPYDLSIAKGTTLRVRAIVADPDGHDYDWVEVGGLQGYVLRDHVTLGASATDGIAGHLGP